MANGKTQALTKEPFWYKNAVIYELHIRSFFDSNADGIGDFRGLTQKLDYLADLGVTALWLLPFYPSPLKDDGYDIADYYSINPMYGNLIDFKRFLHEAHRRGLRVITELVLNHTSDQHSWFQRSRRAAPGSAWRDFYVWTNDPNKYKETRIIFKDFEPSNWSWDPLANAYYWHRFYAHQPDLNFDNPKVHEEIFRVLDFWCDLGVDGFRLDAIPYLYEREGNSCESLPETHQFLKKLRRHVDEKYGDRVFLAEANQWPEEAVTYFGADKGDECHMAFHFPLMPRLFMGVRMEDRIPIVDIIEQTPPLPETSQWALFLRNHDELTLEMVTDEERDYMYRVYARDLKARINLGIRRRLAPLLGNDRRKIELLNMLLFSMPGTPVLYYGDEIGMGDNIYLGDRNGVRTPMHWSSDKNAGFSRATPQALPLPITVDPEYHYESVNVEAQQANSNSLLWWMKRLVRLRKQWKAFGSGTMEFLSPENRKVLAFVRCYHDECILVVANLSRFPEPVTLDLSAFKNRIPVELTGRSAFPPITDAPYFMTLGPHAAYWFSLNPVEANKNGVDGAVSPSLIQISAEDDWDEVLTGSSKQKLESVLVGYVKTRPWFSRKKRDVVGVQIQEVIPLRHETGKNAVVILEVSFLNADPDVYLLPLSFATGPAADLLRASSPELLLATLRLENKPIEGVIYDSTGNIAFPEALLELFARRRTVKGINCELTALTTPFFRSLKGATNRNLQPRILKHEQRNANIVFGDTFFLKLFRRLETGVNPELEASRLLDRKKFPNVPPFAGALELRPDAGEGISLGIFTCAVPDSQSAWEFSLDSLGRYFERVQTIADSPEALARADLSLLSVEQEVPIVVSEIIGTYVESARLLGKRAAELHLALADPEDKNFAPEPFTPFYLRSLYQSIRNRTRETLDLLRRNLKTLPEDLQGDASKLLDLRLDILQHFRALFESNLTGMRIRCHGNFHLGEVLHTGKDFYFVDFEGDPSRSFGERQIKRTPIHDVAKMIRSFDYVARTGLLQQIDRCNASHHQISQMDPWARFWSRWVSLAFLNGYRTVAGKTDLLPSSKEHLAILLYSNVVDEGMVELASEMNYRPDWVGVPLRSILKTFEFWKRDERTRNFAAAKTVPTVGDTNLLS